MIDYLDLDEVALEAEDGRLMIAKRIEITGPGIKVTRKDKLPLEIPLNARPIDFLHHFCYGPERLQSSGLWQPVLFYMTRLRQQLRQAVSPLEEYDIKPEDLAVAIATKLCIENQKEFLEILFSDQTKS
jgi:hypothetical protein